MKSFINSAIAYMMLVIITLSSCGVNIFVHHCCSLESYTSAFVKPDWHASELDSEECGHEIEECSHVSHHHHHCSDIKKCSEVGVVQCGCEDIAVTSTEIPTPNSSSAYITSLNNEHFYIAANIVNIVSSSTFECKPLSTTLLSSASAEQLLSIKDIDSTELLKNNNSSQIVLTSLEVVCRFNRLKIPEDISIV